MPATFSETWRAVKLQVPLADALLCRQWVQHVYNDLTDRYPWHFAFAQTLLSVLASRTIVVGVTQGSTTVTSAALFVATDLNRQFRIGTGPTYTIVTFTDASTIVLDQAYGDVDDAAASVVILDAYTRLPADFGSFEEVRDLSVPRAIFWGRSQRQLSLWDPQRTWTGDPRWLFDLDVDTTGRIRYEWWPRLTTARQFPTRYKRRPAVLADTTTLTGVLGDRPDVLVTGALVKASQWPGPDVVRRNPYFVLGLQQSLASEYDRKVHDLGLRDDDQANQSYDDSRWHEFAQTGRTDTEQLRSTDATVADYF